MKAQEAEEQTTEGATTDTAAPKPPKGKKEKPEKKAGPKLVPNNLTPAVGHNSGQKIPRVVELLAEIMASKDRTKNEGKVQRDCRNALKTEFNIPAAVVNYEISMMTKDPDVRIHIESGIADMKVMTGYQFALDLKKDTVARTEEEFVDPSNKATVETIQRQG